MTDCTAVWNNIRPKLEKIIRFRKELREAEELEDRIFDRKLALRIYSRTVLGVVTYLSSSQVLELPRANELVHKDDARYDITMADLEALGQDVTELNRVQKRRVLKEAATQLVEVRRECGLDGFPPDIVASRRPEKDINELLLHHPTSFGVTSDDHSHGSYSRAIDNILRLNGQTFVASCQYLDPTADLTCYKLENKSQLCIANALYESIGTDAKTMDEMDAMGASFICLRCEPINRGLLRWKGLVRSSRPLYL